MRFAYCRLEGQSGHEAGRQLLARLYREETGQAHPEIAIAPRGRPYFPNSPYYFSISHTRKHAFCVLSEKNIAIDAEELDRKVDLRLAQKVLSPGELVPFAAAADQKRALLTFWVLKEASVKLTGEGLRGYPCHTDFSVHDDRVKEIDGCLVAILED